MSTSLERRMALKDGELAWYERMLEIREFERRTNELFASGEIRGTTHLCVGQEALALGLATVLNPDDVIAATYRSHGIALAFGLTSHTAMAEIMGKATGCAGGVGGSMHMCDQSIGLLPTSAIIGGGMPIATGAALAFQIQKKSNVAVAFFGDAATNIGAFHESLNLAAIWNLPVIFVIDNNVYGEYSRINLTTPIEDLHLRAASYAMPSIKVDGMDIYAVQSAMAEAVDRARTGGGPTLVEAKTYRFSGHSRADQALYRPAGELEMWQKRDPILVTEQSLTAKGLLTESQIVKMKEEMVLFVDQAINMAKSDPEPGVEQMFANIYSPKKVS
ncbi:MAG: thiamine pyrophosphate-dependent dehydrogenase E1 component subunit alpha [Actinomycetes bacterium]